MKTFKIRCFLVLVSMAFFAGCTAENPSARPASSYTTALSIPQEGCPNLYKVSEALYRGAQPEEECFPYLQQMGIRTVVDLRTFHSDEKEMEGTNLNYVSIPMAPWNPKVEHVRKFLSVVTDPAQQPVYLHCKHGADRTGTLVAAYRMIVQGWSKERAIAEMTEGPFGFHEFWSGLPKFLNKINIEILQMEFSKAKLQSSEKQP